MSKVSYGGSHTVSLTISNLYCNNPIIIDVYSKVIYPNGTVVDFVQTDLTLNSSEDPCSSWTWLHTTLMRCKIRVDVNIFIKSPTAMVGWLNTTKHLWATVPAEPWETSPFVDVTGDYYVDPQLPAPDFKVDMKDIAEMSKSFGTYPGHPRWSLVGDLNNDYKINMKDVANVAKRFGWIGIP